MKRPERPIAYRPAFEIENAQISRGAENGGPRAAARFAAELLGVEVQAAPRRGNEGILAVFGAAVHDEDELLARLVHIDLGGRNVIAENDAGGQFEARLRPAESEIEDAAAGETRGLVGHGIEQGPAGGVYALCPGQVDRRTVVRSEIKVVIRVWARAVFRSDPVGDRDNRREHGVAAVGASAGRFADARGGNVGAANDRLAVDALKRIAQDGLGPLKRRGAAGRNDQKAENGVEQGFRSR